MNKMFDIVECMHMYLCLNMRVYPNVNYEYTCMHACMSVYVCESSKYVTQ